MRRTVEIGDDSAEAVSVHDLSITVPKQCSNEMNIEIGDLYSI
jgi:hypothetical protein